jgi:hypothetical protein
VLASPTSGCLRDSIKDAVSLGETNQRGVMED